jgi:signal transduction histidine kinase
MARRIAPGTAVEMALGLCMAAAIAGSALLAVATDPNWPFSLVVGVAVCVTALLRRPRPVLAAATGLALFAAAGAVGAIGAIPTDPPLGGGLVGLLVLGATVAWTQPARPAILVAVAGVAVIACTETVGVHGFFDNRALHALGGATGWAAALAVGVWLRYLDVRRRQAEQEVRRDERLQLARELHDIVAHHVTGIVVRAQATSFTGSRDPDALRSALRDIETAGTDTLAAIRQLVGLLRTPDDSSGVCPVPEPISRLVERFAQHGPPVELRLPTEPPITDWPPQVANTVYRVVQESLTNIARHAPTARTVRVAIAHDPGQVDIEITDDAPGPAPHHPRMASGHGLVGMRERVEALGGQLRAGPRPPAGWAVHASVPVATPGRS